ncbi:MAG: calcium/sodium antiporter [Planctomycetes bacterium]|nr:calcium/sodium antiporter [Planctomycetota bacterium]
MLDLLVEFAADPWSASLILVLGVIVLLIGGHLLVNGAAAIARRLGWSTLVIGLTIVAFGTSAPELFFNVIAAKSGHSEMSFGNIVGSNIANIGLILGVTALFAPLVVHGRIISKELPWLVFISFFALGMALVTFFGKGQSFDRFEGMIMLAAFAAFMIAWYRMGKRDKADPLIVELGTEAEEESQASLPLAISMLIGGLVMLLLGGKLAEIGAVSAAKLLGLSESLIGLTIVAVATSLPELATCVIAVRKGHDDLAIGNIIGSNLFNLLLVLGTTAVITPVVVPGKWGIWDLVAMNVITLLLWPFARTHGKKVSRIEGGILLLLYFGYMTFSVVRELR